MDKTLDEKKAELVRLRKAHGSVQNRWAAAYNKAHEHKNEQAKYKFLMREAENLEVIINRLSEKIDSMICLDCDEHKDACACETEICDECNESFDDCDCCCTCGCSELHCQCDEDEDEDDEDE